MKYFLVIPEIQVSEGRVEFTMSDENRKLGLTGLVMFLFQVTNFHALARCKG